MQTPGTAALTTIRYTLTRIDFFRANIRATLRKRSVQMIFALSGVFLFWSIATHPGEPNDKLAVRVIAALLGVTFSWIAGVVGMLIVIVAALLKRNRGVFCEHEIQLTDAGLVEKTDVNDSLHRWEGFHKICKTKHALYLYVTETVCHVIPVRFFASAQQLGEFEAEVRRRAEAAQRKTSNPI